jgi:chromate transporter
LISSSRLYYGQACSIVAPPARHCIEFMRDAASEDSLLDPGGPEAVLPEAKSQVRLLSLYGVFLRLGLYSFGGGISSWVHREIVDRRHWVTEAEFMSGFALAQILPGVNSTNLTIYVGQHLRGAIGAAVALAGLLSGPFVTVIVVGMLHQRLFAVPGFKAAMAGIAAVAVGMLLRLGIVFARRIKRRALPLAIMAATFVAVGILKWPLIAVVLVLAPVSIAAAWPKRSKSHA